MELINICCETCKNNKNIYKNINNNNLNYYV